MIHTRAFLNHKDYENFINGGEGKVCKPNVSVCEQEYELHFNFTPTIDKDCVPHTAGTVYSYVITYVYKTSSAETQEKKVTVTGNSKDVSFTADDAPEIIVPEYDFMGWSTVRIPTRDEIETEGFIIDPGDRMMTNKNVKLYANYTITVQGLVNENYAVLVSGNSFNTIEIKPECPYNILLVSDWQQVAMNTKQLRTGVDNTIVWNQYLPDEWYTLDLVNFYNNKTLPFKPGAELFWALGDQDYVSNFTIGFSGTTGTSCDYPWYSDDSWDGVFASANDEFYSQTPGNLTVNINGTYSFDSSYMFTNMRNTTALTLNTQTFDCTYTSNMFAGCNSLKTLNINGNFKWDSIKGCNNMFKGDNQLTSIPYNTAYTRDSQYNTLYPMFNGTDGSANCGGLFDASGLTYIGPTLNMNAISLSGCTIGGNQQDALDDMLFNCPNLTDVRIINLNNNDWNFSDKSTKTYIPKMNKDSIEYLVAHLTDCTSNPHTLTFSTNALTNYTMDGDYAVVSTSDPLYHVIADALAKGWTVNFTKKNYLKFTALESSSIKFSGTTNANTLRYSLDDGETWLGPVHNYYIYVQSGSSILWKGTRTPQNYYGIGTFYSTGRFKAEGNVMSLLYGDDYANKLTLNSAYTFCQLFRYCTGLTDASNLVLPATTLANSCYSGMFQGCTSLTTAPELPATTLAQSCYYNMFNNCTSLTSAPSSIGNSATTMAVSACCEMFRGCTSLTSAPKLPATTLAEACYGYMFADCTSLTTAPELPATTLANNCYDSMFYYCSSLTGVPSDYLPATTLAQQCYRGMFARTSLTSVPELPATTLANNCYDTMFYYCTTLTSVPSNFLPSTTLAQQCYGSMFQGCTSLVKAPDLPATTLVNYCYRAMFSGCTSLNYIRCLATYTGATQCTSNWVQGVAPTGTFMKSPDMTSWTIGNNGIPTGWVTKDDGINLSKNEIGLYESGGTSQITVSSTNSVWTATTQDSWITLSQSTGSTGDTNVTITVSSTSEPRTGHVEFTDGNRTLTLSVTQNDDLFTPLTFEITSDGTIYWKRYGYPTAKTIQYSKNGGTLTNLSTGSSISVVSGDVIEFYGNTDTYGSNTSYFHTFSGSTAGFNVKGNMMSLLDKDNYVSKSTLNSAYTFTYLFEYCTGLTDASSLILPATTLANYCYYGMFRGCTSLTSAPELPATTLTQYCYFGMFIGCTSLNYIKCLATDISASNCTTNWVLDVAPTGIFVKDPSMTSWTIGNNGIPTGWVTKDTDDEAFTPLTFVALESGTFKFSGSTADNTLSYSLDSGATWTALAHDTYTPTVQAGDSIMFKGNCTPVPATTLSQPMGIGNFISTGRFNVEGNVMYLISDNNPFNLTDKNYAFARLFYANTNLINAEDMLLPATTLVSYCYLRMFDGCTSLVSVPELPATTLYESCYEFMFRDCTSLTGIPSTLPATTLGNRCYYGMFYHCSSLTSVPSDYLPATTLAQSCYRSMFARTSLTSVPELPAIALDVECYGSMFADCTTLTSVPSNFLPSTTLAQQCYGSMFQGCTSLVKAPDLPATTLVNYCYRAMFSGCTSLNYIKCLATSTGATQCTTGWVNGVASAGTFVKAEEMTSWTIGNNGIPTGWVAEDYHTIRVVKSNCAIYETGGTEQIEVSSDVNPWSATTKDNWITLSQVNGPTGTTNRTLTVLSTSKLRAGTVDFTDGEMTTTLNVIQNDNAFKPLTFVALESGTFKFSGSPQNSITNTPINTLSYSLDSGATWTALPDNTDTPTVQAGDSIMFKGECIPTLYKGIGRFSSTGRYNVEGNIMSLLYGDNYQDKFTLPNITMSDVFYELFRENTKLINAQNLALPATNLSSYCYRQMFRMCTNLVTAPALPATILSGSCYNSMFEGCTSLTSAPELPATTLASGCYYGMFRGCSSLTSIPSTSIGDETTVMKASACCEMFSGCTSLTTAPELPATTLDNGCYKAMFANCTSLTTAPSSVGTSASTIPASACTNMFMGCTGLTTAPILPSTELGYSCYYQMFYGCSSLTTLPELPATTLSVSGYANMFEYCTSLTGVPANYLPATTLAQSCYNGMFWNCTGLTTASLTLPATTLATNCYERMFAGCTSLTTVPTLPAKSLSEGCYGIMFMGCTSLTGVPSDYLPATTLANYCYSHMFHGCTSLTNAPELPARTLSEGCYSSMFADCSNLNYIKCLATSVTATNCTNVWLYGVAASGTFAKAEEMTSWTRDVNGIPTGWTVEDAS